MARDRSLEASERARRVLVGGVNSPVRGFGGVGGTPVFVDRAAGASIFDIDGHRYVDLVCSWGAMIVGHAHPVVVEAVGQAARRGLSFGACCEAEAQLAEVIAGAIPSIELVRFVGSGTEATMSAIRLARAATGRTKIIKFAGCYHGHVDSLLVAAGSGAATLGVPSSPGVPADFAQTTLVADYNDLGSVNRLFGQCGKDVAAIIVEPTAGNMGLVTPDPGFLAGLRTACDRNGAILIFDEVMTGFRVGWGGYQNICGVSPDLTCLGKVIGGGLPAAAFGGRRDLMEMVAPVGPVYQAGTLSGNPLAMAAGRATLDICRQPGFYESLGSASSRLAEGLRAAAVESGVSVQTQALGGMFGMCFSGRPVRNFDDAKASDHAAFAEFFHAMLDGGVWLPPSGYEAMFISSAHGEADIDHVISAGQEAFRSRRS